MVFSNDDFDMLPTDDDREDATRKRTNVSNLADELSEEMVSRFYAGAKTGSVDDWIDQVDPSEAPRKHFAAAGHAPADAGAILKRMFDPNPSPKHAPRFTPELLAQRDRIRALADKLLGSTTAAKRWFGTPFRSALKGKTPIQLMGTMEGCAEVEAFLQSLYPTEE